MSPGVPQNKLGSYSLQDTLGQGPAGVVYRAIETMSGREVALKVVAIARAGEPDNLLRDLQATNDIHGATGLRHPGIVRVSRVDAIGQFTATEMEYVRGMSLRDLLGIVGRLLPERVVAIASQLLDALAYAHARGVLHRDLKPSNILICQDGLVKVADFGFRDACPDPSSLHGSPIHSFAAPEELESARTPDRRSDIWSVGVLTFQMLTGRLPFPMTDPHDLRAWHRGLKVNAPLRASDFAPDIPGELDDAIAQALKYEPGERFSNARELLNALLASGLCAGMIDSEDDLLERQEATCKRIDHRLRIQVNADETKNLPELVRAFSETNPDWEDGATLQRYAGVLNPAERQELEPHAIALTPDEIDHLEEIETRLKSLLAADTAEHEPTGPPAGGLVPDTLIPTNSLLGRNPAPGIVHIPVSDGLSLQKTRIAPLINPKDGAELVFIPPGEFIMGSNGYSEDNAPRRIVTLDGFYIYKYPVTVAQYRLFCEENAYPMPHAYWPWEDVEPIVGITWHEARAYCEWVDVRLPTEAQWEKAARGVDGRAFPWGEQFDQRSDHRLIAKNAGKTVPVGSFPAGCSPWGIMDVVGNVQQWCQDLYDDEYYKSAPSANPPGPKACARRRTSKGGLVQKLFNKSMSQSSNSAEFRVVRGSSWKDYHESYAYAFRRETFPPDLRLPWVGFRCVADFAPQNPD